MISWQILMTCALVCLASAADRWVWSSRNPESKAKSRQIPGFVPTTPEPPITTFRPSLPLTVGRGSDSRSFFQNGLPNHPAFFPQGFLPFDFLPFDVPRINEDGTTKSRVVADTATLDSSSGAILTANDKYTTLDRLQRERGPAPAFPPPKRHQLGGLHPDEVFYADDNLLIIRGGGFNSDVFQEPSQPLDEGEEDIEESIRVSSALPPPSSDQEYNGNIPSIIPPPKDANRGIPVVLPHQVQPSPFSLFVGGSSNNDYILVPYVQDQSLEGSKPNRGTQFITHNSLSTNESQTSSKLRREASSVVSYVYPTPANTQFLHQTHRQPTVGQQQNIGQNQFTNHFQPAALPVVQQHRIFQNSVIVQNQPPVHQQRVVLHRPSIHQQRVVQQRPVVHQQRVVQQRPVVHQQRVVQQRPVVHQQTAIRQPTTHREPFIQSKPVVQQQPHAVTSHFQVPGYPVVQNHHPMVRPVPTQGYPELELQPGAPHHVLSFEGDTDVNFAAPFPSRNPDAEIIQPQFHRPRFIHTPQRSQKPRI